jgi:lipopolysaccharide transport system permease protein
MNRELQNWDWEIDSRRHWWRWELGSLIGYRDLLYRLARRDLLANYQQTVLGPFWILLQPVLTMLVYWVIFGRIMRVSTGGVPPLLFYLSGVIGWNFFSDCLNGTMYTFMTNSAVFNKVYFPRLAVPLSAILAHSVRLAVQLGLFLLVYLVFYMRSAVAAPSPEWFYLPGVFLLMGLFGLGTGLVISVLTAKYRDLEYALQFILRLWMFVSPVFYPASLVSGPLKTWYWLNPMTPLLETFRAICFGREPVELSYFILCVVVILLMAAIGVTLFKRYEGQINDII